MTEELKVTSPEDYASIIEHKLGELVPLPSGMVVRARRSNMEAAALTGGLPLSLVRAAQKLENVLEDGNPEDLSDADIEGAEKALIFMREVTRKNCLEPRIVYDGEQVMWEWPSGARHAVDETDFNALAKWIRGEEVDETDSFREPNRKARRTAAAKSRRKVLRENAVGTAEEQPASA